MHISIAAEKLFSVLGFPVTNSLLMSWLAMAILISVALVFNRQASNIPGKLQALLEIIFERLLNFMDSVTQDRKKSELFLPLVATIFIFIITANWMGLIPGLASVGIKENGEFIPILRPMNTDLNNTLAIALIAVVASHTFGFLVLGFRAHIGKFISFKSPIAFFVGILESISEFSKIISFSFRLFGNIFAGEVLLLVIGGLIPFLVPIPFLGLELFVGFIQALVFAMLTLVFLTISTAEHH
ncbi:MAG: ATP synthase F0 subunit A [Candidatus Terrybacteria bacterium RIFCSPLOWO2_01_FULL_44_24]|uniref:ATP synthase subunit a n=1 Tax=Candidatus Terrybacteria bacterium RIFCSPHIGHO2_01_FULL_43_35 TaxID=1802361 RepID=A0A1G2PFL3_9BACT|nr:MAG: ATP synthase F0 subunit A [Candidatus Terrybacteria bacterium RIFCSPHIGHO2_01_FULL_43_35]OHA49772.1 MAG: ATP synthase F0 subunit A [Candidatus Terrybacteria bacterium RIFCSPHIGHO2_02_FULL_43_14]OHA51594.1 MAG: ATP synthase F0 subunit A [Candidatus Terrybacteria bacterium RIFCSPLOWO2_01_FULL_44_24]